MLMSIFDLFKEKKSLSKTPIWNKHNILRPYHVDVPALPVELYEAILRMRKSGDHGALLNWRVKPGDLVEEGSVIAEYRVPSIRHAREQWHAHIIMPKSGKILFINHSIDHANCRITQKGYAPTSIEFDPKYTLFRYQFACTEELAQSRILSNTVSDLEAYGYWIQYNMHPLKHVALYAEVAAIKNEPINGESYEEMWDKNHPFKKAWAALVGGGSQRVTRVDGPEPVVYNQYS